MATINNLRLTLVSHDHARNLATLRVTYVARLTAIERNLAGLRFRESIQLWGSDSPDADDYLYTFPTNTFPREADGNVVRTREVTLSEDILDEDGFPRPTDEIYAKVWVTPINMPASSYRKSNEIEHRF